MKKIKLEEAVIILPKSKIKVGDGKKEGTYPLYRCSNKIDTYYDEYLLDEEVIIVGTGGNPTIHYNKGKCAYTTQCLVIKSKGEFENKYIYYYLLSRLNIIKRMFRGLAIKQLDKKAFFKLDILLVDKAKQKTIIENLDKISNNIQSKKEQLKKLEELIKSQFVEMFGSVELNDKCFYEQEMSDIADITSSKRIYAHEYQKNGVPFYRSKEIIELGNKKKPSIELFISTKRYEEIKEKCGIPKTGDILITAVGTIGETWIVDTKKPFYYKDGNVLQIRLKKESSKVYFKYVLDILIDIFKRKNVSGSSYSALTIEKFKKMKIIIPPIDLQNQFSEIVKQIDKQKFEIEKSLKETQELYDSLIEEYFNKCTLKDE